MNIRFGFVLLIGILLAGCFPGFPEPDCGGIQNVIVRGIVTDTNLNPIEDAVIFVESQNQNACTGSEPMPDFILVSDDSGIFNGLIPLIYIDDVIRIEVSAEGFGTRSYDDRTYTYFDQQLEIVLHRSK